MSDVIRDLWPEDIKSEDVLSPEEILSYQARRLEERTGAQLTGHVVRRVGNDRVVIGFEVESLRAGRRVRLFEVQHRLDFEYPAAIVPPDESLPEFLRDRVYRPGMAEALTRPVMRGARWVENEWVASSPREFSQKLEKVLRSPAVKGVMLSLLSRASQGQSAGDAEANDS